MQQVQWLVEPAAPDRWRQALSFLPELLSYQSLPETLFVAYAGQDRHTMVGAAAAVPQLKDIHFPGFPAMVRVQEDRRRQGIGRLLIQQLQQDVARWEVPYLHGWQAYADSVQTQFLTACGFRPYLNVYTFEAGREEALHLLALLNKYTQRGSQKTAYSFRPFNSDDLTAEIKLYSEYFQVSYALARQKLQAYLALPNARVLSASLYVQAALQGFVIGYEDTQGVPKVEFWVTQKHRSHTPAAMLLLCNFARQFYELGYPKGRFECNDHARTTLNLLNRLQVVEIARQQSFVLATDLS